MPADAGAASIPIAERGPARLFFALWPDSSLAAALHGTALAAAARCGGRVMRRETLHLTLAFLGDVPLDRLDELRALAAGVRAPATGIMLDRLGYWPQKQIVWAGAGTIPEALAGLAEQLGAALGTAGFRTEGRPFVPHVTLLRKVEKWRDDSGFEILPPLAWRVDRFLLVRSAAGGAYRPLAEWPL